MGNSKAAAREKEVGADDEASWKKVQIYVARSEHKDWELNKQWKVMH